MNNSVLKNLINNYKSGYSLEQPFYLNQDVFDYEWEHIWKMNWFAFRIIHGPYKSLPVQVAMKRCNKRQENIKCEV